MPNKIQVHKQVVEHLGELIQKEKQYAATIYSGKQEEGLKAILETLDSALSRTGETFKVLIVGNFNAGKSSMINALIGEELLPTAMTPETAVIGELYYSETKRITLYPKKGQWPGGDEPFDLEENTPEEIAKYVSLNAGETGNTIEQDQYQVEIGNAESSKKAVSRFEKMVIHWPLEILKGGIVLVDSPGINDASHNDYIVNGYMFQADAIVYLSPCTAAYSGTDRQELVDINKAGYRNIISGYTYYDVAILINKRKPPEVLEAFKTKLIDQMMEHTDLGLRSIHFLSNIEALDAKQAKKKGDKTAEEIEKIEEALSDSGFKDFENFLSHYLVEGKGRDQIRNIATTIILNIRKMIRDAATLDKTANEDITDLMARVDENRARLDSLRMMSMTQANMFRTIINSNVSGLRKKVEEFVYGLADKVDLDGFQPTTKLPTGPRKLWPWGDNGVRHLAKQLQAECQRETERRMNLALMSWCNGELGTLVKRAVADGVEKVRPGLEQIARELREIRADFTGVEASDVNSDFSNTAIGLAYALLTGDWFTGGMAAVYGKGAMARAIGFQIAAGLAMGALIGLGVTITFPVFLAGALIASLVGILTNSNDKQIAKIKKQAVSDLRDFFKGDKGAVTRESIVNSIMKNITDLFDRACDDMKAALQKDIKDEENTIELTIAAKKEDAETQRKRVAARAESVKGLKEIENEVYRVCSDYGLDRDFLQVKS